LIDINHVSKKKVCSICRKCQKDLKFNGLNFERIICLCLNTFKYMRFNGPLINDIYELDFSN